MKPILAFSIGEFKSLLTSCEFNDPGVIATCAFVQQFKKLLSVGKRFSITEPSIPLHVGTKCVLQFKRIYRTKSVTLSMLIAVDPHYNANRHGDHNVAAFADLWYFGKDDSSSRHLDNARHERGLLPVKFVSTTG